MTRSRYVILIALIVAVCAIIPINEYINTAKDSYGREQIRAIGLLQDTRFASFGEYYTDYGALAADSRIDPRKHLLILAEKDTPPEIELSADKKPYLSTHSFRIILTNLDDDGSHRSFWVLDSSKGLSYHRVGKSK